MTDYRIEKLRCPVTVVLTGGQRVRGDIFVRSASPFHGGPQAAAEFLNEDDTYFVLAPVNAPVVVVSKENVITAEAFVAASDESEEVPLHDVCVEVTLTDGQRCGGSVFIDTPADRARLIDYLNSYASTFLAVYDSQKVTLIHRRAVMHVREIL